MRKVVVAAVLAGAAVIGFSAASNADVLSPTDAIGAADTTTATDTLAGGGDSAKWYWVKDNGALVAVEDNNVGPFQACHNNVAGNGVGGAVAGSDIVGILGFDNDGNSATVVKTCEQESEQANDTDKNKGKWYKADEHGIVSVSDNNVGPFQACHNNVSINGVGGAGTISDLTAILGWDNDFNSSESLKTCEQESKQDN